MPDGKKMPNKSPIAHKIAARNKGMGKENAQTVINGLIIVKTPIIPNIEPEAPKLAGQKFTEIMFAIMPEEKKTSKNLLLPMNFSEIKPNKSKANKLKIKCCKEP